jgi:hypothetical protein
VGARVRWLQHVLDRAATEEGPRALAAAEELRAEVEPYPPLRAAAEALTARALVAVGRSVEGVQAAERAAAALRALGALGDLEEVVRLAHAEALLAAGAADEADAVLYQARERLLRKAAKLREPELRASLLQRVPANRRLMALATERLGATG